MTFDVIVGMNKITNPQSRWSYLTAVKISYESNFHRQSLPIIYSNLIKVRYAALNRIDLLQRKGQYPLPAGASEILGVEVSGTIEAVGADCELGYVVGDRVMALLLGGGKGNCVVAVGTKFQI